MELGIFEAIKDNNLDVVRTYLNVNVSYPDNYSALMVACEEADLSIVHDLISRGALINTFNDYGNSPLILAAFYGRNDIVQELLNHGALINSMSPQRTWTALMSACEQNHLSTVRLLLDNGADLNAINNDNINALQFAINAGHQEIIQELLSRGSVPLTNPVEYYYEEGIGFLPIPQEQPTPILHEPLNARIDLGDKSCSICAELYTSGPLYIINPCHHVFHQGCIKPWINMHRNTCPNCRKVMENIQPLTIDSTSGPEYPKENYFLGGGFYNKYKKYSTKLKNF
jgi:ankyrin repeat protein